jgi:multidrug resistance efflux pump
MTMRGITAVSVLALTFLSCANSGETRALEPRSIEMKGELTATRSVALNAPFDCTVTHVNVREGATVREGDVLLELTNPEVDRNLAVARAQRLYAEQKLSAPRTRDEAGGGIAEAAAIVERKKAKRDRYRALFATRDVTLQDLEEAENEYSAAQRDLAAMRVARVPAAEPRIAEVELERARADERMALERQRSLVVRAPISGVVTRLDAVEGRELSPREPLAEVTAVANLEARAEIDPDLLRVIRPGLPVEVKILTVPPKVFLEKVAYVVPFRAGQQGERRSVVVVNITNPDGTLQPGTPALLTIRTQS